MRLLDVYRKVSIELDKYESPSFSVRDFNHFWPSAVDEFIDMKLAVGPDNIQYDHDDLAVLLSDPTSLVFGNGSLSETQAPLPGTYQDAEEAPYRNLLTLKLILNVDTAFGSHAKGDKITVFPRKRTTSRQGFIERNAYLEPNEEDAWYELRGNHLDFFVDSRTSIDSGTIEYVKQPTIGELNPNIHNLTGDDLTSEVNNPTVEFPDHTVTKIVKICRKIFLENIESPRYGTNVQESNFRVN